MWGSVLCLLLAGAHGAWAAPLLPPDAAACAPGTLFEASSQEHSCSETLYRRKDAGAPAMAACRRRLGCWEGLWPAMARAAGGLPAGGRASTDPSSPPPPPPVEPCCRVLSEYYGPTSSRPSRNCFCLESYWVPFVALSGGRAPPARALAAQSCALPTVQQLAGPASLTPSAHTHPPS